MKRGSPLLRFVLAASGLYAQTKNFDVVALKLEPPIKTGEIRLYSYTENPGRIIYTHIRVDNLIADAYGLYTNQIVGVPNWTNSTAYSLSATLPAGASKSDIREMLQSLLAEQLDLRVHKQEKQVRGYVLIEGPHGVRLKPCDSAPPGPSTDGANPRAQVDRRKGRIVGSAISMDQIALLLSVALEQPVVNESKLDGFFDVDLRWSPETMDPGTYASIFSAVEEQFGLRLRSQVVSAKYLIVDHVQREPKSE